jgi:hypothetical protein
MFTRVGNRLQQIAASDRPSAEKIDQAIAMFADMIQQHAAVPAIMLREVAERGAHLDHDTLTALTRVPRLVAAIVQEGVNAGVFRTVNPIFAHFTLFAPILFYLAGAPIRKEISDLHLMNLSSATPDDFVQHMQDTARRALARDLPARAIR